MSYYLYAQPSVCNQINVTTSNPINVVTANNSNINCYSLSVYNDAQVNGNLVVAQSIVCNSISTQNYYTNKVVASSNLVTYDAQVTDILYHPRMIGSNVVNSVILDSDGYIDFSNIKGFPIGSGQSVSSWFQGLASLAGAGASLLNSGVSIGNQLESLFGSGASDATQLGSSLAENLGDSLNDGSGDDNTKYNNSNSVLV
ncbi:MAG: hypothetical protein EOP45_20875, partial [Sphingobacteriaceae bacterium]